MINVLELQCVKQRREQSCESASKMDAARRTAFERQLTNAIKASLQCNSAEREYFIGRHLLAQHWSQSLPSPNGPQEKPDVGLLSAKLTRLLNETREDAGWPLVPVARRLIGGSGSDVEPSGTAGRSDSDARVGPPLPNWWRAEAATLNRSTPTYVPAKPQPPLPKPSQSMSASGGLPSWWRGTSIGLGRVGWD